MQQPTRLLDMIRMQPIKLFLQLHMELHKLMTKLENNKSYGNQLCNKCHRLVCKESKQYQIKLISPVGTSAKWIYGCQCQGFYFSFSNQHLHVTTGNSVGVKKRNRSLQPTSKSI